MRKEKLTKEELEHVVPIALEIYTCFFNELTTAVKNSIGNFEYAIWNTEGANAISYYMGKRAAFREIAERLQKEYGLAANYAKYQEFERGLVLARDTDVEKVYPLNKNMGRLEYRDIIKHRRALAALLEHYFLEGFSVGNAIKEGNGVQPFNPEEFADVCFEHLVDPLYKDLLEEHENIVNE